MKRFLGSGVLLALAFAIPARADTKIKIDTVPDTYTPQNYARSERVRISSFHFEVNPDRTRARVVVTYTYRDQISYATGDAGGGPPSTVVEIPGLTYDAAAHAIVYDANGTKAVCATVREKNSHHLDIKNTTACTVTAVATEHVDEKSWNNDKHSALDTYFNVQ
jgi:hypothetical protein